MSFLPCDLYLYFSIHYKDFRRVIEVSVECFVADTGVHNAGLRFLPTMLSLTFDFTLKSYLLNSVPVTIKLISSSHISAEHQSLISIFLVLMY